MSQNLKKSFQEQDDIGPDFQDMAINLPAGIIVSDPQGRTKYVDPALVRMLEYESAGELINSDADIFGELCVKESDAENIKNVLGTIGHLSDYECLLRKKNGTLLPVSIKGNSVRDKSGNTDYYHCFITDITERKKAWQKFKEKEKTLCAGLRDIPALLCYFTPEGLIVYATQEFCDYLYKSRDEIISSSFLNLIFEEDRELVWKKISSLTPERPVVNYEHRITLSSAELRRQKCTVRCLFDENEKAQYYQFIGVDITENMRKEEELKKLRAELVQARKMESVGMLAGGLAHDFNNLLQAMSGNIELMAMNKSDKHPDKQRLKVVEKSITRASQLVRQLLLFSRKAEILRKPLSVNAEIKDALAILERTIPKMIHIELSLVNDLWPVSADPVQIQQVILNLGRNAVDAMPDGGTLSIKTENLFVDDGGSLEPEPGYYVFMSISDNGMGMDDNILQNIFEPFFTTKGGDKGTGLGLASVYGIVKAHHGHITCDSKTGQGSIFKIYWPAVPDMEIMLHEQDLSPELLCGNEEILVVDDEKDIRELTGHVLRSCGYSVVTAVSGEQALEACSSNGSLDMVILDLNMPGMGGFKCMREILRINPEIKILIISGYSTRAQADNFFKSGAAGYIDKPYQISELIIKVRKILDNPSDRLFSA